MAVIEIMTGIVLILPYLVMQLVKAKLERAQIWEVATTILAIIGVLFLSYVRVVGGM